MQAVQTTTGEIINLNSAAINEIDELKSKGVDFMNAFDTDGNEYVIDLSTIN